MLRQPQYANVPSFGLESQLVTGAQLRWFLLGLSVIESTTEILGLWYCEILVLLMLLRPFCLVNF